MNDNKKQNIPENIHNIIKNNNSSKINNAIKINNENNKGYNKVIKALFDNDNENYNNDINIKKERFKENFYKYNFEKSQNVDSLNNLLLIKNSIGQENIEPMNKFQNRIKNNGGNKIFKIKVDNNLIESKEEEKENESPENIEIKNKDYKLVNENNKKETKGELDLTYNFDNDVFNITQQQMDIMDGEVNKIYNRHKNKIEDKIFKMKYPFLKDKNLYSESNHISKEERQKRLSPIIEKQKLILEKIKKDNISRSNISSSNNIDSDNQTRDKISKSNKIFYPYLNNNSNGNIYINHSQRNNNLQALFPPYNQNSIQFNNDFKNNNIFPNYHNNNIQRYQNLFNNGSLSSENKSVISSSDKINLSKSNKRKIIYEPYTLNDYKRKYEKMNKNRKIFGGLGANIGGEDWINRQKRLERKKQYANYVKSDNEEDFKKQQKIKLKLKSENYEVTKTISSKKSSDFSNGRLTEPSNKRYYNIRTENNIINNNKIKLPLIKERFNNKNNIKRVFDKSNSNKKYKIKESFESDKLNPLYQISGNEKDLNELIKQYEEYNGKF